MLGSIVALIFLWFGLMMIARPHIFVEIVNDWSAGLQRFHYPGRFPGFVAMRYTARARRSIRAAGMALALIAILNLYHWITKILA